MSLRRMIIISKDINGENAKLSTVAVVEFTTEIHLGAYEYEVMLKVKFSSSC